MNSVMRVIRPTHWKAKAIVAAVSCPLLWIVAFALWRKQRGQLAFLLTVCGVCMGLAIPAQTLQRVVVSKTELRFLGPFGGEVVYPLSDVERIICKSGATHESRRTRFSLVFESRTEELPADGIIDEQWEQIVTALREEGFTVDAPTMTR